MTPIRGNRRCARRSSGRSTCSPRRSSSSLARLSVFAGGCTLEAAEDVAGASSTSCRPDRQEPRAADQRYWMLETIREFAAERLQVRTNNRDPPAARGALPRLGRDARANTRARRRPPDTALAPGTRRGASESARCARDAGVGRDHMRLPSGSPRDVAALAGTWGLGGRNPLDRVLPGRGSARNGRAGARSYEALGVFTTVAGDLRRGIELSQAGA